MKKLFFIATTCFLLSNCSHPHAIQGKVVSLNVSIGEYHTASIMLDTDLDGDSDFEVSLSESTSEELFRYWAKYTYQPIFARASKNTDGIYKIDEFINYDSYQRMSKSPN